MAMVRITLSALAALALLATPALAAHCPQDAEAIEHALTTTSLSDEEKADVEALKTQGMEQHEAGNHRESEALLAEAMRKLLLAE
jgi:hypothetical protein